MKNVILFFAIILTSGIARSQNINTESVRFIEVTGSSELEIDPDEIRFEIGIEEYWKEEFEKKTEFKDYKTKVPIAEIESQLLADLAKIGILKESITVKEVGNYWRHRGKEFMISKQLEITLFDFRKVEEITASINTRGINYMLIKELKNKNMTEYRKQVKIEALKAAKVKAAYLLESLGKQVGDVISITELTERNDFGGSQNALSNVVMATPDISGIENIKKIKLRYEMRVKFEIK
jgi:uncharacterized protein YggE